MRRGTSLTRLLPEVQKHFGERARAYDRDNWTNDPVLLTAHVEIAECVHAGRILDFGCGTGILGGIFVSPGVEVTGVDISWEMLMNARARLTHSIQADIHSLPLSRDSFDIILCRQVLHYLNAELALQECRRVLKGGGHLLVSSIVPYGSSDIPWFLGRVKLMKPLQVWTPTTNSILDVVTRTGFELVSSENVQTLTNLSFIVSRTADDRKRKEAAFEYHLAAPDEVKAQYKMKVIDGDIEYWTNWIIALFKKSSSSHSDETRGEKAGY